MRRASLYSAAMVTPVLCDQHIAVPPYAAQEFRDRAFDLLERGVQPPPTFLSPAVIPLPRSAIHLPRGSPPA